MLSCLGTLLYHYYKCILYYDEAMDTVKPLNSGHIGCRTLVRCREVIPISEVDKLATPPILSSLIGFYAEGCGLQEAESASLDQTLSQCMGKNRQNKGVDSVAI